MSSPFSMRLFLASRCLRALALFAWLMLVSVSLPAVSMGSAGSMAHDGMQGAMTSMATQSMHHPAAQAGHHADGCCGNPSQPSCHCDAMCGSVLFPAVAALSGSTALAATYASFHSLGAPTPDLIPPLRPPAAFYSA